MDYKEFAVRAEEMQVWIRSEMDRLFEENPRGFDSTGAYHALEALAHVLPRAVNTLR